MWSLARAKTIPTAERQKHIQDLMVVIRGRVKDIVFKHDASRIVQTVVKYGGQKERDEIAAELKGKYKELAQNKYSKVCSQTPVIFQPIEEFSLSVLDHKINSSMPNPPARHTPRIPIPRTKVTSTPRGILRPRRRI